MPINNPVDVSAATINAMITGATVSGLVTSSGNFAGNDSANRGIPHGLGRIPKIVTLSVGGTLFIFVHWNVAQGYTISIENGAATSQATVTKADTTNFYVGNAGGYFRSGNGAGQTYYWEAIG